MLTRWMLPAVTELATWARRYGGEIQRARGYSDARETDTQTRAKPA